MPVARPVPPSSALIALVAAACSPATATPTAGEAAAKSPPAAARAADVVSTPFDGIWRQASVSCSDGRVPSEPVRELNFDAGSFDLTFVPFETYKDYWGRYEVDRDRGRITFRKEGGNFIPDGLKLEGAMTLDGNTLTIRDVWFGDRTPGAPASKGCDYVFSRYLGGE